ncbi:uncharacterized protein LOC121399957 [Xenopus laevis]|uniref:Uncharacterized protein LOC121399957 n=1 Tax=Xenopus laevis TaxID=8355 RepID=A0A8J1MA36_XENLA|nr:uncharacterized protein LOC121399957 [Xenopus laevis]
MSFYINVIVFYISRRTKDKLSDIEKKRSKTGGGDEKVTSLNQFEAQVQGTIPELLIKGDSKFDSSDVQSVREYATVENSINDFIDLSDTEDFATSSKSQMSKPSLYVDNSKKDIQNELLKICQEGRPAQEECLNVLKQILSVSNAQLEITKENNGFLQTINKGIKTIESALVGYLKMERQLVFTVETDSTDYIIDNPTNTFEQHIGDLPSDTVNVNESKPQSPLLALDSNSHTDENVAITDNSVSQQNDVYNDSFIDQCSTIVKEVLTIETAPPRRSYRKRKSNNILSVGPKKKKKY